MRKQKGFSLVELLVVVVVIVLVAALIRSCVDSSRLWPRTAPFQTYFDVVLPIRDIRTPLTEKQKAILRPLVAKRLADWCDVSTSATNPLVVQTRLNNIDACAEARKVAAKEGLLPAEQQ